MLSWEQLNDSSNRFCWALGESVCPCIFSHRRMYRVSLLILLALTLFDYTYFSYEDFFALVSEPFVDYPGRSKHKSSSASIRLQLQVLLPH
jgi:hypothetical protein